MTAALPTSDFARQMQRRAHALIPGGAHTYAKGDDQFPANAPPFIVRGSGCHVWDLDGREFIEYGMGLRAVTLGHAFAPVVEAAMRQLPHGINFTRPAPIELEAAELLHSLVPGAEMVKFCKDGSHAVDGAIRLARAATGRDLVAICGDHPFFSTGDWFIGTGEMGAGIPPEVPRLVLKFDYNDRAGLQALFDAHPGRIACVLMEAARIDEPEGDYLHWVKETAHAQGALLVFDEMITGFRWHTGGAQALYGVTPDLATFGKALANGFSVSALTGRREFMRLGGIDHDRERVFLLSTTHGAQTHELAAAIATMRFYRDHPVIETLHARGRRLREGIAQVAAAASLSAQIGVVSRDCNLLFYTRDAAGQPSQPLRTLFMQELIRHGILAPSFVVSWSHSEADIDRTIEAVARALPVYRQALDANSVDGLLDGPSVKPVFRRFA
ncbi:MAG TPA: glutamate-1-semialdehyde 2,1-aminomutase [Burkholderiaceae bacterium]|nr:glutamate-1-semialdehyde 2,1-aminomutase [Burkholderiaceae bacterium]HMX11490.1 glutamate-1-semialdehyde 2,1-aminomutase [Burkholderiaceae bacterium]HMZ00539.1 glutamate-1-semialdehyde 2,1-aminomutase [Burkholderiaceae bacterium]HNB45728.1 glutamate-1-semialdehyde 2,1-aminomutase [Burkholderiaceae bacterium]HNG79558.1 glutamate-1-semialdehyde 2,1-aminomutase [Burkholderiaceae bacterium]